MTMILGAISLVQVVFLPGFLLARCLVQLEGTIRTAIITVCLSLLVNHLIVYLLAAVHFYNRISLSIILAVEIAFLILHKSRKSGRAFEFDTSGDLIRLKTGWHEMAAGSVWLLALRRAALFTALVTFTYFACRFIIGFGTIFNQWDDVVSWNRWAVDWYNGRFPTFAGHYPQLLPSVWSITYQAIGTADIQFFAKGLMGLFPLMLLLVMFDLWLRTRAVGYLAGVPITAFLLLFANGVRTVGSGYADVPVAFMAFVPVYLLLTTADEAGSRGRVLFTGSLITAGAALTKQAGLFLMLLYPLVSFYQSPETERRSRGFYKRTAICFLVAVALVLPWYVQTEYRIRMANEPSEIKFVTTDIHQGRGFLNRVADVPRKIEQLVKTSPKLEQLTTLLGASFFDGVQVTYAILLTLIILAAFSLREPFWRVPGLLVMLPFSFIWLIFYSYDFRNLSLALPYLGAGAGISLMHYGELAAGRLRMIRPSAGVLTALVIALLAGSGLVLDRSYLIARQKILLREVGIPEVNRFIYAHVATNETGKIITNYQPLQYLPGLENKYRLVSFDNVRQTAALIASDEARYLLILESELRSSAAVYSLLLDQEKAGSLERLQSPSSGYIVYRVKK
jgi:hypothetical protein